ncbi:hypothetical protein PINS_up006112 [Pythium insidiosum]|nr:hypothetical protein PINS_up006112 [Pythium insidiosum]
MTIQWMTVVFLVCFHLTPHRYKQADFLSAFLELSFIIDIYVRSHLGFYVFGNKVMDLQSIRRQYFKSTLFLIDAIALIPLFVVNWSRNPLHRLDVLNINKLLRLFKVPGQLRALENRYLKWTTELRLFKLLYYTFMLSHIFGCIWFDFASGSSGIFSPEGQGIPAFGRDKWVAWAELEHASLGLQYFSSIFWSFGLMSASSTGELPKECLECVFSVVTMTSGFFLFAYVIGNFTDIIELVDSNQREFYAKMASVRLLLQHFTLPRTIEDRLKTFYAFQRFHTITQEHVLERCLPPSLLTDIRLVHLKPMIDKVSFLQNMNSSVTRLLVSHFTQMLVLRDEYVCRYGEDGYDMFFVFTGVLEVLIPVDQGKTGTSSTASGMSTRLSTRFDLLETDDQLRGMLKKVNELSSGDYFGENGLFTNSARNAYVRALTSCTLYRLSRESLELVFGRYPQWQEKVLRIASLQREQQRLAGLSAEEQQRSCDENMGANLSRVDEINLQAERLEEDLQLVRIRRVDTTLSVQDALRSTALGKVHGRMDNVVRRSATSIFSGANAQSAFHLRWLRLSVFFTVFMALVIPYQITLDKMDRMSGVAPVIKTVEIISELFFALDIWFSWHVTECLDSMELYEQSHRSIYRRQRLFWDVIAAFPFDRLLADFTHSEWLRLLRCAKVANVVVYLGELNRSNISYEMNRFRGAILVYSLLIYWCGCAYLAVCQDAGFGDNWDAWVPSKHLEISDPNDPSPEQLTLRLLRGVFYGMTAFVKKGKTFTPLSVSLVVFSVATCFLGLLVLAFMIGEFATLYVSYIWYEIDFRKNQIAVDLYLSRVRVSNNIKRRAQAFLSSLWSSHYGVNYDSIFTEMPEAIRTSCITHIAQRPLRLFVNNVFRVISNDSPEVIESFALGIARHLHFEGYPRDEIVVSEGSITRAMYIVIKGHLKVTSKADPGITKSKPMIRRGEFFGDRGLLGCAISRTTIRSLRACELLSISAQDMLQVVDEHPVTHLAAAIVNRAQIRMDAFLLAKCSRDEMESHWGTAIFREARHAKKRALDLRERHHHHHHNHSGNSKSFVLSKRHIEEFFRPLSSPSDCAELFLPFLQMLLPHDPLDWHAMQARRGSQILTASSPIADPNELVAQDISQDVRTLKGGIQEEDHKDERKAAQDMGELESIEPGDTVDPLS